MTPEDKARFTQHWAAIVASLPDTLPPESRCRGKTELADIDTKIQALHTEYATQLKALTQQRLLVLFRKFPGQTAKEPPALSRGIDYGEVDAWIADLLQRLDLNFKRDKDGKLKILHVETEKPTNLITVPRALIDSLIAGIYALIEDEKLPKLPEALKYKNHRPRTRKPRVSKTPR